MRLTRREFTATSLAAATLVVAGCGQRTSVARSATAAHHDRETSSGLRYRVRLPPQYDDEADARYSVLIHLHGASLSWSDLQQDMDVVSTMVASAEDAGLLDPMIIVAPHDVSGWSMWANSHDGSHRIASQIVDELIPEVDVMYRTWPVPQCRAIQGFSMGGFGAATMVLKHPELFGAGIVWDGAMHDWESLLVRRPGIAAEHFGGQRAAFVPWSPWEMAAVTPQVSQPLMVVRGALRNYYADYTSHLHDLGYDPALIPLTCPHDLGCLTEVAGADAMAFLASVTSQPAA